MHAVPTVGTAFFPLDKELGLLSGHLTPHAQQCLVRLSAWMPFAQASQLLGDLLGVAVSRASTRRLTERAGASLVAAQTEQAHHLLRSQDQPSSEGAEHLVMSADGAFVPVVGGEWVEVKTVVIGEVAPERQDPGEQRTCKHSSFSRVADASQFTDLATVELARRGIEQAQAVAAVQDGAEWLGGFVEGHRPDAVRILDFAHAASYVHVIGEAARAAGIRLPARWSEILLHQLKQHGPTRVLAHLTTLAARVGTAEIQAKLTYLQKREAHMQYPHFLDQGWPIGSGMVESANKLVVEQRLKGAGMHWNPENLNPMLALRNAVCNDRWDETCQQVTRAQQHLDHQRHLSHAQQRRAQLVSQLTLALLRLVWLPQAAAAQARRPTAPSPSSCSAKPSHPAPTHPWRRPWKPRE